jgi:hypothetical protein
MQLSPAIPKGCSPTGLPTPELRNTSWGRALLFTSLTHLPVAAMLAHPPLHHLAQDGSSLPATVAQTLRLVPTGTLTASVWLLGNLGGEGEGH